MYFIVMLNYSKVFYFFTVIIVIIQQMTNGNCKQYRSLSSTPYRDLFTNKISFQSPNEVIQNKRTTGKIKTFVSDNYLTLVDS